MNYYYDIVLNFLEDKYMFYEWDELDNIEYIKKIPLFQVTNSVFEDFYGHNIKVDEEFLQMIENKTIAKDGKLKYACVLADKNNAFAYEFDDNGWIITRSALVIEDELSLLDYLYTVALKDINYEVGEKINNIDGIRSYNKIKRLITLEIDKLYQEKSMDKLNFLYLEWFNKKESDLEKLYLDMKNKLNKDIGEEEIKIWNIIKLSYNNV